MGTFNKLMNKLNIRLSVVITILSLHALTYAEKSDDLCASNLVRGLIQHGEKDDDPEYKRKALELKKSCAEMQRTKAKLEEARENVEIWQEVAKVVATRPKEDVYHEVLERCVKEYRMHPYDVARMMEKGDPKIKTILNKMRNERDQKIFNHIKAKRIAQRKAQDKKSNKSLNKNGAVNAK